MGNDKFTESSLMGAERQEGRLQGLVDPPGDGLLTHPNDSIVSLFERVATSNPSRIAAVGGNVSLTYESLNTQANYIAKHLHTLGVRPDSFVAIYLDRSPEMLVAMLGTLKAGGAYLPIDPMYPTTRVLEMLGDATPAAILTSASLVTRLTDQISELSVSIIKIEDLLSESSTAVEDLPPTAAADDLAYMIYTSGSTGKPKGVMVTHENVIRLLQQTDPWFHFNSDDVWTLFHSIAFDFSVWEIWGCLLTGGRIVIVPFEISRSPRDFYELLSAEKVTVLNQTPSAFLMLIQLENDLAPMPLSLRYVIFGGEALQYRKLAPWFQRHGDASPQLINMYGITETTVHVSYLPLTAELARNPGGSLIGGNIPDLRIYVLDEHLQPVPVGVAGEMYVAGAGLAQGYLNRPELTAERFVPDPLGAPGTRRYRTGDVARWRSDHTLEYLGRADQQVKIRGFRIELGEIEAALLEHEGVRQAAVTVEEENNAKRLVAYVVPRAGQVINAIDLKRHVRQKLPEAMVPATVVEIAELPLTANGKIDRKRLPKVEGVELRVAKNGLAPRSEIERYLAAVWQEFLQIDKVGAEDNFFDLGGHSLMIVQIQARLAGRFSDRIKVVDFFTYPTIAALAKYLERPQDDTALELAALERADRQLQAFAAVKGGRREAD